MPILKQDGDQKLIGISFPKAGLDVSCPFSKQPNKALPADGTYARSTPVGVNVRTYEPVQDRARGGSRPGLSKFIATQPGGVTWISQLLATLVTVGGSPVQLSQSGRLVYLVAVSQGQVYYVLAGGTTWTLATNHTGNTPPLNFTGLMQSAPAQQKLYFADGTNYAVFVPVTQSVEPWTASAGTLPVDSANNTPRHICNWRDRIVLSGLLYDPQNIFFSAQGDPTDFDYAPLSPSPTDAFALNLGPTGVVGDVVTALIPFNNDVLVIGTDHEIHMISGDPQAGGQIDRVSDAIGIAWGQAWCRDPYGTLYFFSNRCGIYSFVPGQVPQRISQPIDYLLESVNTGTNGIRLIWADNQQGFHVFITPLEAPGTTTHFFWEQRSNSWWEDSFANTNHNPLACCVYDGNSPTDRVALVGSWDGYCRAIDPTATTDDGGAIASQVLIGPILTANLDDVMCYELQAVLGTASGSVTFSVLGGRTAEEAIGSTPLVTGTWTAGRNLNNYIRRSSHAIFIQITSTNQWAMESIRARIGSLGRVRQRGK